MKKIFTLLSVAAFSVAFAQVNTNFGKVEMPAEISGGTLLSPSNLLADHTLVQYSDGNTFNDSTPLCQSQTVGVGSVNHDSRFYSLADYGITSDFTITGIDFVSSVYNGVTFEAFIALLDPSIDITADVIPMTLDDIIDDAYGSLNVGATNSMWHELNLFDPYTIPAGSKFGAAISYEFVNGGDSRAWFGNNDAPQTGKSYIGWPGSDCVDDEGANSVNSLGFPTTSWLMHVKGSTEDMGTIELGSSKLQVSPNPATTELNIKLENSKIAKVEVADVTGRVIPVRVAADGKVNISNLSQGVYFLRAQDDKGVTRIQKFIKK